jgi:hypothetical protein
VGALAFWVYKRVVEQRGEALVHICSFDHGKILKGLLKEFVAL